MTYRASPPEKDRCVVECVKTLSRPVRGRNARQDVRRLKCAFNKAIRFVYDYLVVFNRNNEHIEDHILDVAVRLFQDKADQLVFTSKVPLTGK